MPKAISHTSLSDLQSEPMKAELAELVGDYAELGLDSFMTNGLVRDVPVVRTLAALAHAGKTVYERHRYRQFLAFLDEFISGGDACDEFAKCWDEPVAGERLKELEYLELLLERMIEEESARYLAHLYRAFLMRRITFDDLRRYSQLLERMLPGVSSKERGLTNGTLYLRRRGVL